MGAVSIIVNLPSFINLAKNFIPAVSEKIEWGPLMDVASEATSAYI